MVKKYGRLLLPLLIIFLFYGLPFLTGNAQCQLKELTGMPCPGCGMTRAVLCLLSLDFSGAFAWHPLVFYPPLVAFLLWLQFGRAKSVRMPGWLWGLLLSVFLLVYALRMALYFPHTPPMDYDAGAFLPRLFLRFL